MKNVCILGATGSVGKNTLAVLSEHPEQFSITALSANTNTALMLELCRKHRPRYVALADEKSAAKIADELRAIDPSIQLLAGSAALETLASLNEIDVVMAAIVGSAGLKSTMAAARAGKRLLLANKEALVMAGKLLMQAAKQFGAELLPIDSEHSALMQCMPANYKIGEVEPTLKRLVLTASGGAFRDCPLEELATKTPEQACQHPVWSMGKKITVDSATMMNKALEVIEAKHLFNVRADQIEVFLHPQGVVHSMVEYIDGSVMAQLGTADMRTPIACGLSWPTRIHSGVALLDLLTEKPLTFKRLDNARYPSVQLAYDVLQEDETAAIILNAANELAVDAFLKGKIPFTDIYRVVATALEELPAVPVNNLEDVNVADKQTRDYVRRKLLAASYNK